MVGQNTILTSFNEVPSAQKSKDFVVEEITQEDLDLLKGTEKTIEINSPEVPFEEIVESREMIEERILLIKCRMIDFIVR